MWDSGRRRTGTCSEEEKLAPLWQVEVREKKYLRCWNGLKAASGEAQVAPLYGGNGGMSESGKEA